MHSAVESDRFSGVRARQRKRPVQRVSCPCNPKQTLALPFPFPSHSLALSLRDVLRLLRYNVRDQHLWMRTLLTALTTLTLFATHQDPTAVDQRIREGPTSEP